ncbi:MAG TPA: toxin-antitoxin system HicB family antitoxin [Acidimicrobiales bacterium]|jgi:hypothetical protein
MKMSLVAEGFRADVEAVAELGDELVGEVAERIAAVLARSVPSRILDLLSHVAAELNEELPDGRVEIRLTGDDVEFTYVGDQPAPPEGEADVSARITLRLSESLKTRIEEAAARQALSVNSWIVRLLERGVGISAGTQNDRSSRGGKRLRGYGTS